ncbi:Ig-like domain-containing protein [Domibacillus sp. PGB-M46]|uniref:Ig-like domain-containing protein n=1 Tax=Domibacillus sp. PGB-M46 TaxID=2910255 RepID=UPI001F56AAED|nr:Ig-like domain-containing protein [Domibacillus sp. PGB-M46]MCI2254829.1 Ig-like domain-containing protein [Domibacillus sp. PGB-M46]
MKSLRFLLSLLLTIVLGVTGTTTGFAQNTNSQSLSVKREVADTEEPINAGVDKVLPSKANVDPHYTFTIKFNKEVDPFSLTNTAIYVEDDNGVKLQSEIVSADPKSVKIKAPDGGYEEGKTYILYVTNQVKDKKGRPLAKQTTMQFTIKIGTEKISMETGIEELEQSTMNQASEVIEGEKIVFDGHPAEVESLEKGTIFTTAPTEEFPFGLAGKVGSIDTGGGQTTVQITEPALEELFTELELEGEAPLTEASVIPDDGVTVTTGNSEKRSLASSISLGQDLTFSFEKSLVVGKGETIKLGNVVSSYRGEAEGKFNAEFVLKSPVLKYDVSLVKNYAKVELHNEQQLNVALTGRLAGEMETKYRIGKILIPIQGPVGISGELWAVANASGDVTFEISAKETAVLKMGVEASGGNVSPVEYEKPFDVTAELNLLEFQGKAETSVGLQPSLFIAAFSKDIVGITSEIGYGNIIEGKTGKLEFDGKVCLKGHDGLYANASAALKFPVQASQPLFDWEHVLKERDDCPAFEEIEISQKNLLLEKGKEMNLEVIAHYADKSTKNVSEAKNGTTYTSSNEQAVTVDENGKLKVLPDAKVGEEVTITAEKEEKKASVKVKVIDIESVSISPEDLQLAPGESKQIAFLAKMTNGETLDLTKMQGEVSYQSENSAIARISDDGMVYVSDKIIAGIPPVELSASFRGHEANANIVVKSGSGEQQGLGLLAKSPAAAGYEHSVFLKNDGTVWTWGKNDVGQLGDGTNNNRFLPGQVAGLSDIIAVDAGFNFNVALRQDGTVWAWGSNSSGQLGNGTNVHSAVPVQVQGIQDAVSIAAGSSTAYAILIDGTVLSWGWGGNGLLGNGQEGSSTTPVQVTGLDKVISIDSSLNVFGERHTVALRSDKTVWAWGRGYFGAVGAGEAGDSFWGKTYTTPVQVKSLDRQPLTDIVAVAAGDTHSIALHENGTVYGWGNGWGDAFFDSSNHPVIKKEADGQTNLSNVKWISAGGFQENVVVKNDGTVWTWVAGKAPVQVKNLSNIRKTATGGYHSFAITKGGSVWAWGWNNYGQLGDGTTRWRSTSPVELSTLK